VAETLWDLLNSLAAGGAMWLAAILALALLGELGLPFTCPIIESLLVFAGFRLMHGTALATVAPFLLIAYAGRLLGSASAYHLSSRLGPDLLQRHVRWLRVTPERLEELRLRLSSLVTPTIVLARFTPGLTVLTTMACGISHMRKGQFLKAVAGQLVAWEVAFLTAGALGGLAVRSIDPSTYPKAVAIIIGVSISVSALGSYTVFNLARRKTPVGTRPAPGMPTSRVP
jgi:membrane protein DedA with SNARE-associated domain